MTQGIEKAAISQPEWDGSTSEKLGIPTSRRELKVARVSTEKVQ